MPGSQRPPGVQNERTAAPTRMARTSASIQARPRRAASTPSKPIAAAVIAPHSNTPGAISTHFHADGSARPPSDAAAMPADRALAATIKGKIPSAVPVVVVHPPRVAVGVEGITALVAINTKSTSGGVGKKGYIAGKSG